MNEDKNWIDNLEEKINKKNKKIEPLKKELDEIQDRIKKFEGDGGSYDTTSDENIKKDYRRRYELIKKINTIRNGK